MNATEDQRIIELFAERDERALTELSAQYGGACRNLAAQILENEEDADEVLNDAMLRLWNAIPPAQPDDLFKYLSKTVRRLAYQKLRNRKAVKRGGGQTLLSLDDAVSQAVSAPETPESLLDYQLTVEAVNRFLRTLPPDACSVFVMRYGRDCSVKEIAEMFGFTQSKVLVTLLRTRNRLRQWLKKEGWL